MMTLGKKLQHYRTQAGLSQRVLAERLGTTQNRVYLWERDMQEPSVAYILNICTMYNITPNDLLL